MTTGKIEHITPIGVAAGGHYTPAVRAGGFIFVAGQTPRDGDRKVIGRTIEEQTEVTLRNVEYVLEAAGSKLQDVVKVTAYLRDLTMFPQFNEAYARYFPHRPPARTTVGCELNGVLVEIDVVAFSSDPT